MLVQVEIPNKYAEANLRVFAGMTPVARRFVNKGWEVKTGSCSMCGACCLTIDERHPLGTPDGCKHLQRSPGDQLCGMAIFRPYGCAIADGTQAGVEKCTVRWEPVE